MSEVVIPQAQIEREPVRHLPIILDERSSVNPAQDLVQIAGQSTDSACGIVFPAMSSRFPSQAGLDLGDP